MKLIGNNHSKHAAPSHASDHGKHAAAPKKSEEIKEVPAAETPVAEKSAAETAPAVPAEKSAEQEKFAAAFAPAPAEAPKEKKAKRSGAKKGLKAAMVSLAVVVVVVLGVIIGYSMWETPPDIVGPAQLLTTPTPAAPTPTPDSGDEPGGDVEASPEPSQEVVENEFDGALMTERADGIYTFLLVGRDYASNSTDTIIVGKFDTNAHTIDMVNIPRDTLININWGTTPKKINAVYPGYTNSGYSGINGLRDHVKNFLGFDVDFYAVVNINVVVDIINAVGGVDFDVPIDMDYDDPSQHFHVHLKKGYQHLDGYQALGVFRFRMGGYVNGVPTAGYPGGDVQRIETQQALLMAIAQQTLSLGNIPNLTNIIDLCVKNVETTLNASNMAFFARQFLKCSMSDINFHEMPISTYSIINGVSYVSVATDSWIKLINERLNPYSEPVTRANVSIITANETGSWIDSTTGYIAGSWESFYCQTCSAKNGWKSTWHTPGACPTSDPDEDDPFTEEEPIISDAPVTEDPFVSDAPVTEEPVITDTPVTEDPFVSDTPVVETPPVAETPPAETPVE